MAAGGEGLTRAEQMLLALLYAPGRSRPPAEPLVGRVNLVKLLFLLWKNPVTGPALRDEIDFEPYDYGPYSEWVDVALSELDSRDLVTQEAGRPTRIALTRKGLRKGRAAFEALSDEERGVVEDVKESFGHLSTAALLERIYAAYPDYATASKWRRTG